MLTKPKPYKFKATTGGEFRVYRGFYKACVRYTDDSIRLL